MSTPSSKVHTPSGATAFDKSWANRRSQSAESGCVSGASAGAAYRQSTQTVVLSGQAVADVTTLPEGNVEAAHFEGQSIVVDLAKSTLTAREATIEVTTEVDVPEEQ